MKFLSVERISPHRFKTPEGYLICTDAILSRTGKQTYRRSEVFGVDCQDADEEVQIDRQYDEVFSNAAMSSFENKPICIEHPNEDVNIDNYKEYSVGFVRDVHQGKVDGQDVMLGTLVITDKEAIEGIENGEHTDLSCGYDCDIQDEENPQQRNIRGNHVALCQQGRAGIARIVDSGKVPSNKIVMGNMYSFEIEGRASSIDQLLNKFKAKYPTVWDEWAEEFKYYINNKYKDGYIDVTENEMPNYVLHIEYDKNYYSVNKGWGYMYVKEHKDRFDDSLIQSSSKEAVKKNIATEIRSGKDPKQAAAIAHSIRRENDATDFIKGIIFTSHTPIQASAFTDFIGDGYIKLDSNVYMLIWHDGTSHASKENTIKSCEDPEYFAVSTVAGKLDVDDFNNLSKYNKYKQELIMKAKKYFRIVDSINDQSYKIRYPDELKLGDKIDVNGITGEIKRIKHNNQLYYFDVDLNGTIKSIEYNTQSRIYKIDDSYDSEICDSLSEADKEIVDDAIYWAKRNNKYTVNGVLAQIEEDTSGFIGRNKNDVISYIKSKGIHDAKPAPSGLERDLKNTLATLPYGDQVTVSIKPVSLRGGTVQKVLLTAELTYRTFSKIAEALDKVLAKYDQDAYFDAETSGRWEAFLWSTEQGVKMDSIKDRGNVDLPEDEDSQFRYSDAFGREIFVTKWGSNEYIIDGGKENFNDKSMTKQQVETYLDKCGAKFSKVIRDTLKDDWSKGISFTFKVSTDSLKKAYENKKAIVGNQKSPFDKLIGSNSVYFNTSSYDFYYAYVNIDRNQSEISQNYYDDAFTYKEFGGKKDFNKAKLTEAMKRESDRLKSALVKAGLKIQQSKVEIGGSSKFNSVWRQAQSYNDSVKDKDYDNDSRLQNILKKYATSKPKLMGRNMVMSLVKDLKRAGYSVDEADDIIYNYLALPDDYATIGTVYDSQKKYEVRYKDSNNNIHIDIIKSDSLTTAIKQVKRNMKNGRN